MVCKEADCHKPVDRRGWCSMHYTRWKRYGDQNFRHRLRGEAPVERFWSKVEKSAGCWRWLAGVNARGYGSFWDGTEHVGAHCFAWRMEHGDIPDGMTVDHLCRNHGCVNPEHLRLATQQENILAGVSLSAKNARKTACGACGAPYDGKTKNGRRFCRQCAREREVLRTERRRQERVAAREAVA